MNDSLKFETAFRNLLKSEGGYINNQNDFGGETNFGISKKSYPKLNIKEITVEDAKEIYYKDFWLHGNYEKIKNELIYVKAFSLAVNMGEKNSNKIIQRAIRAATKNQKKLLEDGIIGEKTLFEINNLNENVLCAAISAEAAGHYRLIAATNSTQSQFINGWLNRAYS